ncbi:hypothetical protein DFP72DRAFT_1028806 [Ephemerocybe angulata]|uniref:TECPR1-like DysF domain-containing protein n=1 Tax=Ephemerocybe angulata TaxID=980116 RepID=A0A8H6MHR3_9AGAR|nr:hypothetical protein DFP72DRAFT_1028806 [Tulosesus angulatus]
MPGELVVSPNSVTSFDVEHNNVPFPSSLVHDDDPNGVEAARHRFAKKKRFLSVPSLHRRRSRKSGERERTPEPEVLPETIDQDITLGTQDVHPINLSVASAPVVTYDESRDHYEWAVVYENQRGAMLFSTPYYSSLSLLPTDPSPFTLPDASKKRSEQPPITLDTYPLPDGNWKWVSRCWMIDMRSNLGEVQHDGFEYNWMFRKHHWRSQVGPLSAGGWVRRRRWIRLMVRPAKPPHRDHDSSGDLSRANTPDAGSSGSSNKQKYRRSVGLSLPPSVATGSTRSSQLADHWKDMNPDDVWLGDSPEADWERLRHFMRRFGRDGRKLEVWRLWLGYYHPEHKDKFSDLDGKGTRREKQWTEDDGPLQSELAGLKIFSKESVALAPRDFVIPVLRQYGQKLLRSFIYPDSRAQFLKLLALSGLLTEMNIPMGNTLDVMSEIDFWSYTTSFTTENGIPDTPPVLKRSVMEEQEREEKRLQSRKGSASPSINSLVVSR